MQLIQPTEDINTIMSAETESPMNGNVSEILKEINLVPNTNGATVAYVQDTFEDIKNMSSAEMAENALLEEKQFQDNKVHSPVSNLAETENRSLNNEENYVSENMANGKPSSQELQQLEINDNNPISKAVDTELCQPIAQIPSDEKLEKCISKEVQSNLNSFNETNTITSCEDRKEIVNISVCDKSIEENTNDTSEMNSSDNDFVKQNVSEDDGTALEEKNEKILMSKTIDEDKSCAEEEFFGKIKHKNMTMDLDNDPETEIEKSSVIIDMPNIASENKRLELISAPTELDNSNAIDVLENGINGNLENLNVSNTIQLKSILENIDSDQKPSENLESNNTSVEKPVNLEDSADKMDVEILEDQTIQERNLENCNDIPMEDAENALPTVDGPKDTVKKDIVESRDENFKSIYDIPVAETNVSLPVSGVCNSDDAIKEIDVNISEKDISQSVSLQTCKEISIRKEENIVAPKSDEYVQKMEVETVEQNATHNENLKLSESILSTEIEAVSSDVNMEINAFDIKNKLKESISSVQPTKSFPITEESPDGNGTEKTTSAASMKVDDTEIVNLEDEKIEEASTDKSQTSSVDTACIDISVSNETKTELSLGAVLENKASEESVILCEDIESKESAESTATVKMCKTVVKEINGSGNDKEETINIIDEDDVNIIENKCDEVTLPQNKEKSPEKEVSKTLPVVCKLSNTLDILSDDEEEPSNAETNTPQTKPEEKQCINLDDDDDVMLIEEDSNLKESQSEDKEVLNTAEVPLKPDSEPKLESGKETTDFNDLTPKINEKDTSLENISTMDVELPQTENIFDETDKTTNTKPLLPQNFLKTAKKSLAEMSRHELEDFCILRIVESIVDRSNLSEIKTKMKTMAQNLEDYRKRALMMTKQNRDLQVVLKSVQEEQKKRANVPIQPLKITRSVGMQVLMNDKLDARRKAPIPTPTQPNHPSNPSRPLRTIQNVKQIKPATPPNIPVPRKVPVNNSPVKTLTNTSTSNNISNKSASPNPSALRNPSPVQKFPEKRTHSRMQSTSGVTVDLTDDEPPPKVINKTPSTPPVRVVPPQSLMPQNRQFGNQPLNNARKVYIPISGPTAQVRPTQTLMVRPSIQANSPRPRLQAPGRSPQNSTRPRQTARHPAPLPDAMKQYTPPTWKNLPPAPDLKLSKVENGIVISWKIDGYPDGSYETIASYQLYAYQETSAAPCTALWKKIGDVKALALPMACTLTQFMAGFKYYFAVRAVDVRSRLGPFSLPGSILLLNKV